MEVFTFGGGDFLFQIFSAVTGLMGDGNYETLIRITVILGFLFIGYSLFLSFNISQFMAGFFKQYIVVILLIYTLFIPKTNVVINDLVKNTTVTVNNVPYGVGLFAHIFTTTEKGITNMMETYYSIPSDLRYSKSGYAMSALFIDSMRAATLKDPYVLRTLNDYIVNCFFHDILWGSKDLNTDVIHSTDLFNSMSPEHSTGILTNTYSSAYPTGQAVTCQSSYNSLSSTISSAITDAKDDLDKILNLNTAIISPAVTNYVLHQSLSVGTIIKQSLTANLMSKAVAETSTYTGVSGDAIAYMTSMAEHQNRSAWLTSGELAKKYIPILRQVLEAVVYGAFPIMFLMMMTPFSMQAFKMYITLLVWLLMWSPLFSILNLIVTTRLEGVMSPVYTKYTLGNLPFIYESTANIVAMAGYFAFLVPVLAFAIAKGSEYALVSLSSGISSSASGTASNQANSVVGSAGVSMAQTLGTIQAQEQFANTWSHGIAAQQYYNMAHGVGLHNLGGGVATLAYGAVAKQRQFANMSLGRENAYISQFGMNYDNKMKEHSKTGGGIDIGTFETQKELSDNMFNGSPVKLGVTSAQANYSGMVGGIAQSGSPSQYIENLRNEAMGHHARIMERASSMQKIAKEMLGQDLSQQQAYVLASKYDAQFEAIKSGGAGKYLDDVGMTQAVMVIAQREGISHGQVLSAMQRMAMLGQDVSNMQEVAKTARSISLAQETSMGSMTKDKLNNLMKASGLNYEFTSGGTAFMSFDTDGKMMSMGVKTADGKYVTFDGGTLKESATKSGEALKPIAQALREAGRVDMAKGIENAISKEQAVTFDMNIDPSSGRIGSVSASSGGGVSNSDFRIDTKGWESIQKALNTTDIGNRYINKNVNDTRNQNLSGSDTVSGNKVTVDNSATIRSGVDKQHLDINESRVARGMQVSSGLSSAYIMNEDKGGFVSAYQDFGKMMNAGNSVPIRGLADNIGKELSSYGDIKKGLMESVTNTINAGAKITPGGKLGAILKGVGIEISAGMSVEAAKKAIDNVEVSTLKMAVQKVTSDEIKRIAEKGAGRDPNQTIGAIYDTSKAMWDIISGQANTSKTGRVAGAIKKDLSEGFNTGLGGSFNDRQDRLRNILRKDTESKSRY